jgi:hypothetical protein
MVVIISSGELMVVSHAKHVIRNRCFLKPKFSCIVSRNVDAGISLQRKAARLTTTTNLQWLKFFGTYNYMNLM